MRRFDVAVIGAGTAGLSAFRAARSHTDNVALIESGPFGTTCARIGCMPSKALIAAARSAQAVRSADRFGVHATLDRIDGREVLERVRGLRARFVGGIKDGVAAIPDDLILRGHASFKSPGVLSVDGETVEAERVVIATGSESIVPDPIREGVGEQLMTVGDLWEMEDLPGRLVVFGAGVIGCETAQAMAHLGVEVTCLSKGGFVGSLTDPEVLQEAKSIFGADYELHPDMDIENIAWKDGALDVSFSARGQTYSKRFDAALAATGRKPRLDGLDLEASGLEMEDGVPLFDRHTRLCKGPEDRPVFIAGDADDGLMVLPDAAREGEAAGHNAATWPTRDEKAHRGEQLQIVFTEPSMAVVGQSFGMLEGRDDVVIGCASFSDQGRARTEGRNRGIVRIYGERGSGRFLGSEMIAPDGEHLAHLLTWSSEAGMTVLQMARASVYHPVLEEGLRTALEDCADRV